MIADANDAADRAERSRELRAKIDQGRRTLDLEDLLTILPHRPPLLLLDQVVALVPGQHAVAMKRVSGREAGLASSHGPFVFPSTLAVEALAQLGEIVASEIAIPEDRKRLVGDWPRLLSVESSEVHLEMLGPGSLHLTVSRLGEGGEEGIPFVGQVTLDGALYVEARFSIQP